MVLRCPQHPFLVCYHHYSTSFIFVFTRIMSDLVQHHLVCRIFFLTPIHFVNLILVTDLNTLIYYSRLQCSCVLSSRDKRILCCINIHFVSINGSALSLSLLFRLPSFLHSKLSVLPIVFSIGLLVLEPATHRTAFMEFHTFVVFVDLSASVSFSPILVFYRLK